MASPVEKRNVAIIILSILIVIAIISILILVFTRKNKNQCTNTTNTSKLTILLVSTPTTNPNDYQTNLPKILSACQQAYSNANISTDNDLYHAINDLNFSSPNLPQPIQGSTQTKNVNAYWCIPAVYSSNNQYYVGFPSNPSSSGHVNCGDGNNEIIQTPRTPNGDNSLNGIVNCYNNSSGCIFKNNPLPFDPNLSGFWISVYTTDSPVNVFYKVNNQIKNSFSTASVNLVYSQVN